MKEKYPDISPASGVFISYENPESSERIGKGIWRHVAVLLTGLPDSQIDQFAKFIFVNPADGKKLFESGHRNV